jgi:ComF family protein
VSAGLATTLLQLLLPTRCVLCQRIGPACVCPDCARSLEAVGTRHCLRCGRRRLTAYAASDCGECSGQPFRVERARSLYLYNDAARHLLAEFKFQSHLGAGRYLATQLAQWAGCGLERLFDAPELQLACALPVPLHRKRLRERSFNQSELLARQLATAGRLEYRPGLLQRVRETPSQVGLTAHQRRENVRGAFAVPESQCAWLVGRAVLLVDDLMTTGSTLSACASALRRGGSGPVYALTLFTTLPGYEAAGTV